MRLRVLHVTCRCKHVSVFSLEARGASHCAVHLRVRGRPVQHTVDGTGSDGDDDDDLGRTTMAGTKRSAEASSSSGVRPPKIHKGSGRGQGFRIAPAHMPRDAYQGGGTSETQAAMPGR